MKRRWSLLVLALIGLELLVIALLLRERAAPPAPEGTSPLPRAQVAPGVYFTNPRYTQNRTSYQGGPDEPLVALMEGATETLDVAINNIDLANVAEAMARASQRKVRVRMVTDTDSLNEARSETVRSVFATLQQAGIPIVDDQRPAIMHHKFTVVDGEWVSTGSMNYTQGDAYRSNNNHFITQSRELASNYTAEFEKMFVQRRFGPGKPRGVPNPRLTIDGASVENYFAPEDGVADRLIDTINSRAVRSLHFLAFSFTHDGLGQAVIGRARNGVPVQGVFETAGSSTKFSQHTKMKQAGLDVYQDGNPFSMHHKVMILDERIVVFGSFNFSENADKSNDENLLIVDEPGLARAFKADYDRVLSIAKKPLSRNN